MPYANTPVRNPSSPTRIEVHDYVPGRGWRQHLIENDGVWLDQYHVIASGCDARPAILLTVIDLTASIVSLSESPPPGAQSVCATCRNSPQSVVQAGWAAYLFGNDGNP